jgi:hypothetical protein
MALGLSSVIQQRLAKKKWCGFMWRTSAPPCQPAASSDPAMQLSSANHCTEKTLWGTSLMADTPHDHSPQSTGHQRSRHIVTPGATARNPAGGDQRQVAGDQESMRNDDGDHKRVWSSHTSEWRMIPSWWAPAAGSGQPAGLRHGLLAPQPKQAALCIRPGTYPVVPRENTAWPGGKTASHHRVTSLPSTPSQRQRIG